MWFIAALTSAVFYSSKSLLEKIYVAKVDKYVLALAVRLFALPLFLLPLLINPELIIPLQDLPLKFWLATIYVAAFSTPVEMIFFYKALQNEQISYLVPILSFSPVITTLFGYLFFKETPSFLGFLGIFLIVVSVYLLNVNKAGEGIFEPFRRLSGNKSVRYLSVMLFFYSIAIVIDKVAITGANLYYYAFINYLMVSSSLFLIALYKAKSHLTQLKTNFLPLGTIGIIVAIYTLLRFYALQHGISSYVSSIMATSTIITMLFGLFFLKETNKTQKIIVGLIATLGIVLIKFAS
jgi:uncharacterized membrane protein